MKSLRPILFAVLIGTFFLPGKSLGYTFFTSREIPEFSAEGQKILDEYKLKFASINSVGFSVKRHNREILKLIDEFGERWKYDLLEKFPYEKEHPVYRFIRGLTSVDVVKKGDATYEGSYYEHYQNGLISCRKIISDDKSVAAYINRKISLTCWDKQGKKTSSRTWRQTGSGCCFGGACKIQLSDGTEKPIQDLQRGDSVLTWNPETKEFRSSCVLLIPGIIHHEYYKLDFGSDSLIITDEHPLLDVNGHWRALNPGESMYGNIFGPELENVRQLKAGNKLRWTAHEKTEFRTLKKIERFEKTSIMYTISDYMNPNRRDAFIINGFIVPVEGINIQ